VSRICFVNRYMNECMHEAHLPITSQKRYVGWRDFVIEKDHTQISRIRC